MHLKTHLKHVASRLSGFKTPRNNESPRSLAFGFHKYFGVWKLDETLTLVLLSICSDEGLTLETSAFQSPHGGQFTLSTPLINQFSCFTPPPTQHHSFFRN